MRAIECGDCVACCKRDVVKLHPKLDDFDTYEWHQEQDAAGNVFAVLDRREDGACVYLGESGCTIHERKPMVCKAFDCRVLFMETPPARRVVRMRENPTMREVYEAARLRLTEV